MKMEMMLSPPDYQGQQQHQQGQVNPLAMSHPNLDDLIGASKPPPSYEMANRMRSPPTHQQQQQMHGGMPGQVTFDIFLLGVVISTAPAFAIALVYTIRIETSFEAYYLTVFYGLELAHTLLSKGIFRLSKCSCAARSAAAIMTT